MYKRTYEKRNGKIRNHIVVDFVRDEEGVLAAFLSSETHNFASHIVEALDDVLSGRKKEIYFSGNMVACEGNAEEVEVYYNYMEEELGPSVFMPTAKLKELVDEWIEMEDKFKKGQLDGKLPLVIED